MYKYVFVIAKHYSLLVLEDYMRCFARLIAEGCRAVTS